MMRPETEQNCSGGGNEFYLNPQENTVSYRIKIREDSPIRFKIRLTGDAVDGDYVQLLNVQVVSSKLTYVYSVFCLICFVLIIDLGAFWYFRYYRALSAERQVVCVMLALVAFFAGLPLYQPGLATGPDFTFHLQRIEGIYKGLLSGQFPVRIQPGWLDGNGYAASIFYGDVFLYFPALLRMVGFTIQEAYKIYAQSVNVATVLIAYYAFRTMTKDDLGAVVGSFLYAESGIRLTWLYAGGIGTYSGMMFYPLVIAGFYCLFFDDVKDKAYKKLWILLTVGFTGLLMTHMISCLMVGVFSFVACLVMIKRLLRKETICELFKAVFASVLLNLWYLVPFFQYMRTEKLHINGLLTGAVASHDYYALLADFMQGEVNFYNLFIRQNSMGYAITAVLLLYIITMPLQKKEAIVKKSRAVFWYMIFVFWVCTGFFPVKELAEKSKIILKYFQAIQYQDRMLNVAVALAACIGAFFIAVNAPEKKVKYLLVGLLFCINLYQSFEYYKSVVPEVVYLEDVDLYSYIGKSPYGYGIGNGEYLPLATDTQKITKEIQADEMLQVIDCEKEYLSYDTTVINATDQERSIIFPIIFYSGYESYDLQNKEALQTTAGDNGCVEVNVPAGYSGTFRMTYNSPLLWHIAEIVSLLTFGFILYYEGKCHGIILSMKNKAQKGV